jgi:hypothetical protein
LTWGLSLVAALSVSAEAVFGGIGHLSSVTFSKLVLESLTLEERVGSSDKGSSIVGDRDVDVAFETPSFAPRVSDNEVRVESIEFISDSEHSMVEVLTVDVENTSSVKGEGSGIDSDGNSVLGEGSEEAVSVTLRNIDGRGNLDVNTALGLVASLVSGMVGVFFLSADFVGHLIVGLHVVIDVVHPSSIASF